MKDGLLVGGAVAVFYFWFISSEEKKRGLRSMFTKTMVEIHGLDVTFDCPESEKV